MPKRRHTPLVLIVAVLLVPFIALRMCSRSRIAAPRPANPASYEPQGGRPMSFALRINRICQRRTNRQAVHLRWRRPLARAELVGRPRRGAISGPHSRRSRRARRRLDTLARLEHPRPRHVPAEGAPKVEVLDNGARQGLNDFRRIGYGGPCPPPGHPHRYFFRLFALDVRLDLKPGASRGELERAMAPHILAQTQWMGTYKR